jgi:exonuclease VII small subunit
MSLRRRLKQLEAHALAKTPEPPGNYPTTAEAIGELDGLIRRLDEQVREMEEDPDGYVEGCDDARYGEETIEEHEARVDALMDALDERHEAWRREHRPDLPVGIPEIDDHIAELKAEIALLKAEEGEG